TTKEKASAQLARGAKKVINTAPGAKDVDATIVYRFNHALMKATDTVISNPSSTTNSIPPLAKTLNAAIGNHSPMKTTNHAYTTDQDLP
ncbi:erythrose-4-phosphate dehydrogenase, partial [Undibacterium sp. CCC1.1]|nr:erythrose-4-phosphate dehydrogenase [Undibacterium sp. CCC1.1]